MPSNNHPPYTIDTSKPVSLKFIGPSARPNTSIRDPNIAKNPIETVMDAATQPPVIRMNRGTFFPAIKGTQSGKIRPHFCARARQSSAQRIWKS
jgi:hypothetical protein